MKTSTKVWIWIPRILCILFIIIGIGSGIGMLQDTLKQGIGIINAIITSLGGTIILLILLIVAWKRQLLGGILIIILGLIMSLLIVFALNSAAQTATPDGAKAISFMKIFSLLLMFIPFALIGALFFFSHFRKKKDNSKQKAMEM
jgi:hypothetical protein